MSRTQTSNHGRTIRIVTVLRQRLERLKLVAHVIVQASCGDPDEIIEYRRSQAPKREMKADYLVFFAKELPEIQQIADDLGRAFHELPADPLSIQQRVAVTLGTTNRALSSYAGSHMRRAVWGEPTLTNELARQLEPLSQLIDSLAARPGPVSRTSKQRRAEANVKAREYLRRNPLATARALAAAIGCALGMVSSLPAWKAVQDERAKGRQPKRPRVVNLTQKLKNVTGLENDQLAKLVADQQADEEPSPLENDPPRDEGAPRRAKVYRRK